MKRKEEWNDIYDENRQLTGRVHRRGSAWGPGKSFAGTWENSGGAAQAGETSRQAIRRELREETGIDAPEEAFELLESGQDRNTFYDFYALRHPTPLREIHLQEGETDDVMWASFGKIRWMVRSGKICKIIGTQYRRQEKLLFLRNMPKTHR